MQQSYLDIEVSAEAVKDPVLGEPLQPGVVHQADGHLPVHLGSGINSDVRTGQFLFINQLPVPNPILPGRFISIDASPCCCDTLRQ